MNLRKLLGIVAVCTAVLGFAGVQAAPMVYEVSSTGKLNCPGSPHGLWTNKLELGGGSCAQYYDYQAGSTLTVDTTAGTAVLNATAENPAGITAVINFAWDNLVPAASWTGMVKNGGGGNPADWLYFGSGTGSVTFFSGGSLLGTVALTIVPDTALQIGWGANDKTSEFGASSWLRTPSQYYRHFGTHWDFNMDLAAVPEPSTLALLMLGMASLVLRRRMNA